MSSLAFPLSSFLCSLPVEVSLGGSSFNPGSLQILELNLQSGTSYNTKNLALLLEILQNLLEIPPFAKGWSPPQFK